MEIKLFNTLGKKKVSIKIYRNKIFRIYLCGPTVYDNIHVGNLRSIIIFDVINRLLLNLKIKVNYVQNITDVDDKIIAKSILKKTSEKKISQFYTKSYFKILKKYNIIKPNNSPLVTNYINKIKKLITILIKRKLAYNFKDEIYFKIKKNSDYGKISGQNLNNLRTGLREINKTKKNEYDFVLWKKTNKGINWESPWGKGRPGWHTECVSMINENFNNKTIEIHGGGSDLIFPHHENERIQNLSLKKKELSKIWFHVAHIKVNKKKMSKSENNFISAEDFEKKYGSNALRFIIFNTKYNKVINLNENLIKQSIDYIKKLENAVKKIRFYLYENKIKMLIKKNKKIREIINFLLNDLNILKVLFYMEGFITLINKKILKDNIKEEINNLFFIFKILGFNFIISDYSSEEKMLIKNWKKLRKNFNYLEADKIRKILEIKNIL